MIEFIAEGHMYLVDGQITPSVTTIVAHITGKSYEGIPQQILDAKSDYGNRIHDWVEHYLETGKKKPQTKLMKISTDQLQQIKKKFKIISSEVPVAYRTDYAGTYDMVGFKGNDAVLIDIKTTAEFDQEYLEWQLGMYKLAIETAGFITDIKECYCLWMPKGKKVELINIEPKTKEEIEEALNEFKHSQQREEELPEW